MNTFSWSPRWLVGACILLTLAVGCAPAATPTTAPVQPAAPRPPAPPPPPPSPELAAALARFPIKDGEVWQLAAVSPDGKTLQRYTMRLSADTVESGGVLIGQGTAAQRLVSLAFRLDDAALLVVVTLDAAKDPAVVACSFTRAAAGRVAYQGQSFFGAFSDVERLGSLPASRLGTCTLQKT